MVRTSSFLQCSLALVLLTLAKPSSGQSDDFDMWGLVVIDVMVVLDTPALEMWMAQPFVGTEDRVREEITMLFFETNVIYQSLRAYDLNIEIRLFDIVFLNRTLIWEYYLTDEDGLIVEPQTALYALGEWMLEIEGVITGWDHIMYFTHVDLKSCNGFCWIFQICHSYHGSSVVEVGYHQERLTTITHELGHSLGMEHDDLFGRPECEDPTYIMYPNGISGSEGRWYFSPCSGDGVKNVLSQVTNRNTPYPCLAEYFSDPIVSKRFGELLTLDEHCYRTFPYGDMYWTETSGYDSCSLMTCTDGRRQYTTGTPEGMPCGDGMRCFYGHCVEYDD